MTAQPDADDSVRLPWARARSASYGLVSHGFRYPDRTLAETLTDPGRWASWPEWLRGMDGEAGNRLDAVHALLGAGVSPPSGQAGDPAGVASELQETFVALFGHAVRGKYPPYELEYGRSEIIQRAAELADVVGFYAAFGMEIADDADERADHITVECEFMSVLCAKEAHALTTGNGDLLETCVDAQRGFLRDHLARWLPGFAHCVGQADPRGFYGALAGFAGALVAAECRRFEITLGPELIELRPADPTLDTTISCRDAGGGSGAATDQPVQLGIDPTLGGS